MGPSQWVESLSSRPRGLQIKQVQVEQSSSYQFTSAAACTAKAPAGQCLGRIGCPMCQRRLAFRAAMRVRKAHQTASSHVLEHLMLGGCWFPEGLQTHRQFPKHSFRSRSFPKHGFRALALDLEDSRVLWSECVGSKKRKQIKLLGCSMFNLES